MKRLCLCLCLCLLALGCGDDKPDPKTSGPPSREELARQERKAEQDRTAQLLSKVGVKAVDRTGAYSFGITLNYKVNPTAWPDRYPHVKRQFVEALCAHVDGLVSTEDARADERYEGTVGGDRYMVVVCRSPLTKQERQWVESARDSSGIIRELMVRR